MPRGDGRLSHDLDPLEPGPQDACGVFGVWARGEEVAKLTYFGLYALQHRGQEAAGIAVSDGTGVVVYKDLGLVAQVFDEPTLASLRGHIAIGHTRYSTTGGSNWENAQPTLRATPSAAATAAPHHDRAGPQRQPGQHGRAGQAGRRARPGRRRHLRHRAGDQPARRPARPVGRGGRAGGAADAARRVQLRLHGRGHAVRGPRPAGRPPAGARPAGARLGGGERDGRAGHRRRERRARGRAGRADRHRRGRPALTRFANPEPKGCLFEYVYLARPDTTIAGRNVYAARVAIGRTLAREHPVEADLVIGVPESGTPAAIGYAEESGIPYGAGLVKNAYVGRTFIQPSQTHPPARHPAQAQPAARQRARQADRRGGRLDRARQHPAGARADAARGGRGRGARPHLVAAGEVAVLLRHRLRHPGRAARQRARHRRHPALDRRRLARLRLAGRADRRDRAAARPGCAGRASTGSTRSRCRPTT